MRREHEPDEHVGAARERNWELIGHGFSQKNMQKVADERDDIRKTSAAIRNAAGKSPRGWLGPGLTETWETPDLLAEEGYDYVCDWVLDDQPVWLKTRGKPMLSIPYTQECNDVAMMLIQHHKASEFYERFPQPEVSRDDSVSAPVAADEIWAGDAREMDRYGSVAERLGGPGGPAGSGPSSWSRPASRASRWCRTTLPGRRRRPIVRAAARPGADGGGRGLARHRAVAHRLSFSA